MIHPSTRVQFINEELGYGVFASQFIPKGTIVYVKDDLEIDISPWAYELYDPHLKPHIDKYSFIDERGHRIFSWDLAKYVNHCCHPNTISTGYGFEIAICDIQEGEEITDEYGLFNLEHPMCVQCEKANCRALVQKEDVDQYFEIWDAQIKSALEHFETVDQPLAVFLEPSTTELLTNYFQSPEKYLSVKHLTFNPLTILQSIRRVA